MPVAKWENSRMVAIDVKKGNWSTDNIFPLHPDISVILYPVWAGIKWKLSYQKLNESFIWLAD